MKSSLLLIPLLALIAVGAWWLSHISGPRSAALQAADQGTQSAPDVRSAPEAVELSAPAAVVPRKDAAKESVPAQPPVDEQPEVAVAKGPLQATSTEEVQWTAAYGEASQGELRSMVDKFSRAAEEERQRLASEPDPSWSSRVVWADWEATPWQVEQQFSRPGAVAVARLLDAEKYGKARFELIYPPPDRAPEFAALQRQIAWLESRIPAADH